MNVKALVGKKVFVQFKGPMLMPRVDGDSLAILLVQGEQQGGQPAQLPFIVADVVVDGDEAYFEYDDPTGAPFKIRTAVGDEHIAFLHVRGPEKSRLIVPRN